MLSSKERWSVSTIRSVLTNEKYKGEAILQKSFTVDYLTKKKKKNQGEVPMYHVKSSHQAIVEPEVFEMAQAEIEKRSKLKGQHTGGSVFSSKIMCADCHNFFGSKVWHSATKYRKTVWQCRYKFKRKKKCETPHLYEEQIKKLFVLGFNKLLEDKDEIIENCRAVIEVIGDTKSLETEKARLCGESRLLFSKIQSYIDKNTSQTLDQQEYKENYIKISAGYEEVKKKIQDAEFKLQKARVNKIALEGFLNDFPKDAELITSFDEKLFSSVVDKIVADVNNQVIFIFKNGHETPVRLEEISQ
ncbi:MAG: recombinase family protein [Oscillospiraceae bacterium]|nr:recombinase family protein [Oscillospiraceae bacterium]